MSTNGAASVETYVQMYYEGATHERLVASVPADNTIASTLDVDAHLLQFSMVYAVDTNTSTLGTESVSITCLTSSALTLTSNGFAWASVESSVFEMHDVIGEPERVGWHLACDRIMTSSTYTSGQYVGLVVDAFQADHWTINCHATPVENGWFLPPGFVLIYAREGASGTAVNQMLKVCHRGARAHYRTVTSSAGGPSLTPAPGGAPYRAYRGWEKLS